MAPKIDPKFSKCSELQKLNSDNPCCVGQSGERICVENSDGYESNYTPGPNSKLWFIAVGSFAAGVLGGAYVGRMLQSKPEQTSDRWLEMIYSLSAEQMAQYSSAQELVCVANIPEAEDLGATISRLEKYVKLMENLASSFYYYDYDHDTVKVAKGAAVIRDGLTSQLFALAALYERAGMYDRAIEVYNKVISYSAYPEKKTAARYAADVLQRVQARVVSTAGAVVDGVAVRGIAEAARTTGVTEATSAASARGAVVDGAPRDTSVRVEGREDRPAERAVDHVTGGK